MTKEVFEVKQEEDVGNCIKSFGEIQVDNVHHSPHINQAGYFVIEGDEVCQAQFALGESILAFPNHMLHTTCGGSSQEIIFCNFPRD